MMRPVATAALMLSGVAPAARRSTLQASAAAMTASTAQRIRGAARRRPHRAEAREDAVAEELVDGAIMVADQRDEARLVLVEELHELVGGDLRGEAREAPDVHVHDRGVADDALTWPHLLLGARDAARHLRCEEAGKLPRSRPFRHGPHEEAPRAGERDGDDDGHRQDRDHLVELGADEDAVG